MPAPLRIKLNDAEDETLKALSYGDSVPCRTKARATALRMNAQGWNVPDIALASGMGRADSAASD